MAIEFYAHYNPTTNRIEAVKQTPDADANLITIKITEQQASKILIDNCSVLDLTLGFDDKNEMSIVDKIDTNVIASKNDASLLIKIDERVVHPEVLLKMFKDKLEVYVNSELPFVKLGMDKITFYFTAKNEPTRLIDKIEVDISKLTPTSTVTIPLFAAIAEQPTEVAKFITINTTEDYRNCSVFTIKKFKSYKVEICK